jgi:hypothetical protein
MRRTSIGLTIAGLAALWLTACGGGGGSGSSSSGGGANSAPTANAGAAQSVAAFTTVTLLGTGSDSDGSIASYAWTQTAGPAVQTSATNFAVLTFEAPSLPTTTVLTFSLVVTDNRGATSAPSTVNITVQGTVNTPPVANAGVPQTVLSGTTVTLEGTGVDANGTVQTYAWTQTSGPAVTLSSPSVARPTFTAPVVTSTTLLTFSLVVTDNDGASSAPATADVNVNPVGTSLVTITGRIRHARPPYDAAPPNGLNYGAPVLEPSRGVLVQALNAGTSTVIATASTDGSGNYALQVPSVTSVQIRAVARLVRDNSQPLPRYDVRVQNGATTGLEPYSYTDSAFNSSGGTTRNVDIPLNISFTGQATGTRASGPFAILDSIYDGIQFVLSASPTLNFPPLLVDWGSQTQGTFFTSGNPQAGIPQRIALLSDLTADTDEFDAHVVAHEFGHYVENNFSRSDSIGGPHGVGDKLDIRLAFGEGFGYAFAAMVLDDPFARDSFVDNGTQVSGGFNIEDNPPAGSNDPHGCWCSESSVWAILYDIFDDTQDPGDTVALGFQPIWDVLVGAQADTPAFTSIFSFITALKTAQPASVTGINSLLSAQNITTNTNAFATTETIQPILAAGSPTIDPTSVLPLYTTITNSGTRTLRTTNDAGTSNKLGNHRYIRFENGSTRNVTITVATSNTDTNADPDFLVWRAGELIWDGTDPPPGPEMHNIPDLPAGTYLIDVYDCGNGCGPPEGASGDYDLTVTIN